MAISEFQYRLVLLNHTSTCCRLIRCRAFPQCEETKELLCHLETCTDPDCQVKHCLSSRYLLHHHAHCRNNDHCEVCKLLNDVKARKCKRAKSTVVVRNLSRKRSFNEMGLQLCHQQFLGGGEDSSHSETSSVEDPSPRFQRSRHESNWDADTVSSKSPLPPAAAVVAAADVSYYHHLQAEEEPTLPLSWLSEQIYANFFFSDQHIIPLLCTLQPITTTMATITKRSSNNHTNVASPCACSGDVLLDRRQVVGKEKVEEEEEEEAAFNALLDHIHQLN